MKLKGKKKTPKTPVTPQTEGASKVDASGGDIDVRVVKIDDIETNDYNPNSMEQETFELLTAHIRDEGKMVQPILVRHNPNETPPYMVVDGEHRFKAARSAGMDELMVVVVPYDEDEARIRTISMNQLRGNYVPMRMANLIHDLQEKYSIADLQRLTGIKEDEMKSLTDLLEVPEINFDDSPTISNEMIERPIGVNIMLMPDEHSSYHQAMLKAMELGGPKVVPLVAEEVGQYDKAMTAAFGVQGTKLRNVGLAVICRVFNTLSEEQIELTLQDIAAKE